LPISAAPLKLTGSDLLANPSVQFPIGAPSLNGASLVFDTNGIGFGKHASIPLGQFGVVFTGAPTTVSFSVNLTRLTDDWDAFIVLGDGTSLLGAAAGDNSNGQGAAEVMDDLGDRGSNPNPTATILFTNAGFPSIGGSFDFVFSFLLESSQTTMDVSFNGGSATHVFSRSLNAGAPLSLVFIRDNESYERYQLNSITLNAPNGIPEPGSLALAALGLTAIGFTRRRRK